ncbi:MAG: hypothetical protein QOI66_4690 [Myxococcales bacterium]|jgi:multisubunit Na+/H+ antiporter MnhB subunit|nr:hypothetical protein [Myxococcales bacterium]
MTSWSKLTIAALHTVAASILVVSVTPFFLASGSDSLVEIRSPTLAIKALAVVASTAALLWAIFGERRRRIRRFGVYLLGVCVLGMATHAVIVNYKKGVVQEYWFFAKFDRAPFDIADGIAQDWRVRPTIGGVFLTHKRTGRRVFVFTGVGPFRIDAGPLHP